MGEQRNLRNNRCRSCASNDFVVFYQTAEIPIAGIYYDSNAEKIDARGTITLCRCRSCGLVQLKETINPDIYDNYSFVGNSSGSYEQHLKMIATKLICDWNIEYKKVYEVGASNGILLGYLGELGNNHVNGIEPSRKLCDYASKRGISIQQGYFNREFIRKNHIDKVDCVIIRHVLEHIDDLNDMIFSIREILHNDGLLVVEVPDVKRILDNNLFSNIFHEHLNYFSIDSLNYLFLGSGFNMVYQQEVDIHGGSILAIYQMGNNKLLDYGKQLSIDIDTSLSSFAEKARKYYSLIHEKISRLIADNKIVHGYGASHRTFILLGNADLSIADIPVIYDNNEFLHNKRLNGFSSLVLPTDCICINQPDVIVIFATSYEQEIIDFLVKQCQFNGEIISLRHEVVCNEC